MFPQNCSVATSDGLTYLSDAKSYSTSAGKWETLTIKFKTGENTELIQFIYNDQGGNTYVHYDDFVITKKQLKSKFKRDANFSISFSFLIK